MLDMPTTPEEIVTQLENLGISYKLYHHEAVFTVEESTHIHEKIDGGHCRNLFLALRSGFGKI